MNRSVEWTGLNSNIYISWPPGWYLSDIVEVVRTSLQPLLMPSCKGIFVSNRIVYSLGLLESFLYLFSLPPLYFFILHHAYKRDSIGVWRELR